MSIVGGLILTYFLLCLIYMGLMMVVLHTHQTKTKKLPPVFLWEFRKELKEEYPDATRWARTIFVLGVALVPVWLFLLKD